MVQIKQTKGFTVLEMMIAVAILSILASQTIPVVTRLRISSNEAATQKNLQAVRDGFEMFHAFSRRYPNSFGETLGYLDSSLMVGQKHGYALALSNTSDTTYMVTATPLRPNITGVRTFILDQSGTIRIQDATTLTGGYNPLAWRSFQWQILGSNFTNSTFSLFWKFTNALDRALNEVILAVQNMQFGGTAVGSELLSDGRIPFSTNASRMVDYYRLGSLSAGASAVVEEKVAMPNPRSGWWYSRSFSFWESK